MTQVSQQQSASQIGQGHSLSDLLERLAQFDGPPQQFLTNLLAVQCRLAWALAGAFVRPLQGANPEVLAVYPPLDSTAPAPDWLVASLGAVGEAAATGTVAIRPMRDAEELYGQAARRHLILIPIKGPGGVRGVGCFCLAANDPNVLAASRERLEMTASLLNLYEMRLALAGRQADFHRLQTAMETLAAVNRPDRFVSAAMAMCNEVAARWQCDRVSLGFLKGRYVKLRATSHTEKFNRKMKLIQDTEAAMEECLDQDLEIVHPADPQATFLARAAGELSRCHGPSYVVSFPLRRDGKPVAILTAERAIDRPMSVEEAESLRLACELCAPRLVYLQEHDRWVGARAVARTGKVLGLVLGPRHTWVKLLVLGLVAAGLFACLGQTDYRAEGTFSFEAAQRQVVAAPFDGFLEAVYAEPNTPVEANTLLATLDTVDLERQLAEASMEQFSYEKEAAKAHSEDKFAEEQIAKANAARLGAKIALARHHISQANLVSPVAGVVLTGDLKRKIKAPVKTGDVLFEVGPLSKLEADVYVPEDQIADVRVGAPGQLAAAGKAGEHVGFKVVRVNPMAELVKQQNVFRVRVSLDEVKSWMRPGMEGVAKIDVDRRSYLGVWTRSMVNWVRMKLWM